MQSSSLSKTQTIHLESLDVSAVVGTDAWSRSRAQPLVISIHLIIPPSPSPLPSQDEALLPDDRRLDVCDDLRHTISYGTIAKSLLTLAGSRSFSSLADLASSIISLAISEHWPGQNLEIDVRAPKALLRTVGDDPRSRSGGEGKGQGLGLKVLLSRSHHPSASASSSSPNSSAGWQVRQQTYHLGTFPLACIIGMNPPEREEKQMVLVGLTLHIHPSSPSSSSSSKPSSSQEVSSLPEIPTEVFRALARETCELVETSSFQTVEALGDLVCDSLVYTPTSTSTSSTSQAQAQANKVDTPVIRESMRPFNRIGVAIFKPSAISSAAAAGVEVECEIPRPRPNPDPGAGSGPDQA